MVDDIHTEFKRLKALGVKFKAEEPIAIEAGVNKGGYTIYFTDPDGITLELLQPPP
jgi:catechol 2,3-dioxygenase-like lactoylglutathione lyase family enzyme